MLGRELRSKLDILKETPKPETHPRQNNSDANLRYQPGEIVMVKDFRTRRPGWIPGIVRKLLGTRMVLVDVSIGSWRRHFDQLRKCSQDLNVFEGGEAEQDVATLLMSLHDSDHSDNEAEDSSLHSASDDESDVGNVQNPESVEIPADQEEPQAVSENVQVAELVETPDIGTQGNRANQRLGIRSTEGVPPPRFCDSDTFQE